MTDVTPTPPELLANDFGMQDFQMVTLDQLPDPTPAAGSENLWGMWSGNLHEIYMLALIGTGMWFLGSLAIGRANWMVGVAFVGLAYVGSM